MDEELKKVLIEIIDYLNQKKFTKGEVLGIINPIDTVEQGKKLMNWIKQNDKANPSQMRAQAKRIVRES